MTKQIHIQMKHLGRELQKQGEVHTLDPVPGRTNAKTYKIKLVLATLDAITFVYPSLLQRRTRERIISGML